MLFLIDKPMIHFCVFGKLEPFFITATRVEEFNIPSLRNPPGKPGRFNGRLRGVSIYIKYIDGTHDKIVGGGVRGSNIIRGRNGH